MAMLPHERSLVAKHTNSPFVIIGVNSDRTEERIVRESARLAVTWRSFWDKGEDGPIATRWNVDGWPTLYLIDHEGVIRNKWVGEVEDDVLDQEIEELVRRAQE